MSIDSRRPISARECRAARAGLRLSQKEIAEAAGVAERTVIDFERGARAPIGSTRAAIRSAFERAGVVFGEVEGALVLPPAGEGADAG